MANNNQNRAKPVPVSAINPDKLNPVDRRRPVQLLPGVFNTDLNKKFFAGSADHLFQPESTQRLSAFIGQKPTYTNKSTDFYISEPDDARKFHQLEATMVSKDTNGNITNTLFYDDLVNQLRFQGGLTADEDRLFSTEYYSWCPPVNLDMLMNYTNYYWYPAGPDIVRITETTNVAASIGSANPVTLGGVDLVDGMKILLVNDVNYLYRDRIFVVSGIGTSFQLTLDSDIFKYLWDDVNIAWDQGPWDGQDPKLVISVDDPDYIVMERGARDGNPWSSRNKWYHISELNVSQLTDALSHQARRPIIEFEKNLELYNYGTFGRAPATVRDDVTTDPDIQIVGKMSIANPSPITIDGIQIQNGDTILFTNRPTLQGTWDIEGWDLEQAPNGIWDQFFNVNYSAIAGDIITSMQAVTNFGQFTTMSANFIALGFKPGMTINVSGTVAQNGVYTINNVTTTTITVNETFTNLTGIGLPQPFNVTFVELRTTYQNRVFKVDGIGTPGGISLTIVADGQNPDGSPADGDEIKILYGNVHAGKEYHWSDADHLWILSQQKLTINQAPLFQLYDTVGVKLQDPGKYPLSTFQGNRLFGYEINTSTSQAYDNVLGIRLTYNDFGEIEFQNYLVTDRYSYNFPLTEIIGYYFHRIVGATVSEDVYGNDWFLVENETKQFIEEEFVVANDQVDSITLKLTPDSISTIQIYVNYQPLSNSIQWELNRNVIGFNTFFNPKDVIDVTYYSSQIATDDNKPVYTIPLNLQANPDNLEIDFISNSDWFAHFTEIIKNQPNLIGNPNGINNWRNTIQDRSLGREILQHRAPMLKLMALASNKDIDFMLSIRYNEREYSRFKNKFIRKINDYNNDGIHFDTTPESGWVEDALTAINLGKTITDFPFAYSGMGSRTNGQPTYIPSTPSRLGAYQVYTPSSYIDDTYSTPQLVLQFHDGSLMPAYGDYRDNVLLYLDQEIYDLIPSEYKDEENLDFDWFSLLPGAFRNTEYSVNEFNHLLTPIIQRWAISHGFDLNKNEGLYSPDDPFTWNYNSTGYPGYWRGIYKYFYDTDRPHTHPWEMLGFSQEPSWWTHRYGLPPYTSASVLMWDDIRLGRIASGPRQGIDTRFQRLTMIVPVDGEGKLKNPLELGVPQPGIVDANAPWKIGDHGPVETVYRRSEYWPFAVNQISYLMKPVKYIELNWDGNKTLYRYPTQKDKQWLNTDFEKRPHNSQLFIHGQNLDDGSIYTSNGIQQWISDYVTSNGKDIDTIFSQTIRSLGVNLAHKMAGFVDGDVTKSLADNFGLVPQENQHIVLYTSPSIKEEAYSGVIVERVPGGWSIYGYDVLNPVFNILPSVNTSPVIAIDVGKIRVLEYTDFYTTVNQIPYGTVYSTQQDVYNFLICYSKWLEQQGWVFDQFDQELNANKDWRLAGKQFVFWSQGNWEIGSLITLSPSAQQIKFTSDHGAVQSIEQIINGVYSLLDRDGRVIQPEDTFVSRYENDLVVLPNDSQAVYSARMFVAEYEHVIVYDNSTIFNDLIYNPLYNLRQPRFKLSTTRCNEWVGRYDAPGFIITGDGIIPNYEKTVNDFRRYFGIEDGVDQQTLRDTARHLIGYQSRDYLDGLRLNDDSQFEFYQGFIREKGTILGFEKLLRSEISTSAANLKFLEEWALRVGEFGATSNEITAEFILQESDYRADPQIIEFKGSMLKYAISATSNSLTLKNPVDFPASGVITIDNEVLGYTGKTNDQLTGLIRGQKGTLAASHAVNAKVSLFDNQFDDIITIGLDDNRWYRLPPNDGRVSFSYRPLNIAKRDKNANYYYREDMPLSGYPLESEVTFRVQTIDDRDAIFNNSLTTNADLSFGNTVWVDNVEFNYSINNPNNLVDDDPNAIFNFGFMVYRYTQLYNGSELEFTLNGKSKNYPVTVETIDDHGLNNNYYIMLDGVVPANNFNQTMNGSYNIANVEINFVGDGSTTLFNSSTLLYPDDTIVKIADLNGIVTTLNVADDYEFNGGTNKVTGSNGAKYTKGQSIVINGSVITLDTPAIPCEIVGATSPSPYVLGSSISINLFPVTFSNGTDLNSAAISINSAGITGVVASVANNALKVANSASGGDLVFFNTASVVGSVTNPVLTAGGTLTVVINSIPYNITVNTGDTASIVASAINNANIPNFVSNVFGNALRMMEVIGNSFSISSSPSSILTNLGITATTYVPGNTANILFGGSWTPGSIPATVDSAIKDITNAVNNNFISNITATKSTTGALVITNTVGESLDLRNGIGSTALTDLGINENLYLASGPNIRLLSVLPLGYKLNIRRNRHFDISNFIFDVVNMDTTNATIGIYTESRFLDLSNRDNAKDPRGNNIPWVDGELVYVDNGIPVSQLNQFAKWVVFERSSSNWIIKDNNGISRIQNDRVDSDLITQSLLYNKGTNLIDAYLNIWDPAKGLYPAQLMREITYKLEYDPAVYTNGDIVLFDIDAQQSWGEDQVGQVWWDISAVEYENYETGSNRERRNKWGRLAPGKSINVYEWVRSSVPPTQWATYVAQNADQPESSFRYKPSGQAFQADVTDNPPYSTRTTFNQVTGSDEITYYFWVINSSTLPNIPNRHIPIDELSRELTDPTGAGIPWFAPINENSIIISNVGPFLSDEDSVFRLNYDYVKTDNNLHTEWRLSREGDPNDKPTDQFWNKMEDSLCGFDINNNPVPDPNLEQSRRYGNFIRPRQTWFIDRSQATKIFIDGLNSQLINVDVVNTRPTYINKLNETTQDPILYDGVLPHPDGSNRPINQYDYHVSSIADRDDLFFVPGLNVNDQIWVDGQTDTQGFWTVYRYTGLDIVTNKPAFTLVYYQTYRVSDFWNYVDYYAQGYSSSTRINITVNTIADRNAIVDLYDGLIVKVLDSVGDSTNVWALYVYNSADQFNSWIEIGRNNSTIHFNSTLLVDNSYGQFNSSIDNIDKLTSVKGNDAALRIIIDAVRQDISTDLEQNLLFYKMINYVMSEQIVVDWVFKTSYILGISYSQTAKQDPVQTDDPVQYLIDFIQESKPYHTKLRDFIINANFGTEEVLTHVTDFDKPVYFDKALGQYRVLDDTNNSDRAIMATVGSSQYDWFNNYQINQNLVRHFNTTLLFDRVSCDAGSGWDSVFGWDFGVNEDWDAVALDFLNGAADRIIRYYKPQPFNAVDVASDEVDPVSNIQETKNIRSLISGCNFRGSFVDGGGLIVDINDIDTYLNGGTLQNPGVPNNPEDIVVDGNLFIQPYFDGDHPEELVLSTVGEAIAITVSTQEAIGSPSIVNRIYSGIGVGPYKIGQTPASTQAIFVFLNGIRLNDTQDYTYDNVNNTITLTVPGPGDNISYVDNINIISFSKSGGESQQSTDIFVGDGSTVNYTLSTTPPSNDSVFVTKNGQILTLGIDYTITGTTLHLSAIPAMNDSIIATVFDSNKFTNIFTKEYIVSNPIISPASNTYDIGQMVTAGRIPSEASSVDNLFVSVNGVRQIPFDPSQTQKYDYVVDYVNSKVLFVVNVIGKSNPNVVVGESLIINGNTVTMTGSTINSAIDDINNANITDVNALLSPEQNSIIIVGTIGNSINLVEGSGALTDLGFVANAYQSNLNIDDSILITSIKNDFGQVRIVYSGNNIIQLNQDVIIDEQVDLFVNGSLKTRNIDYTVDLLNNQINLQSVLTNTMVTGDEIDVFIYYVSTQTYPGSPIGEYTLYQPIQDFPYKTFVYVNGVKANLNADYEITSNLTIKFIQPQQANDQVVVTQFTARDSAPAITFRLFLNNLAAKEANNIKPQVNTKLIQPLVASGSPFDNLNFASNFKSTTGFPINGVLVVIKDNGISNEIEFIKYNNLFETVVVGSTNVSDPNGETIFINGFQIAMNISGPNYAQNAAIKIVQANIPNITASTDGNILKIINVAGSAIQLQEGNGTALANLGFVDGVYYPEIIRGYNGTNIVAHSIGETVLILDPSVNQLADWTAYRISDINKTKLSQPLSTQDTEIFLDSVAGLPKQGPGETMMKIPGVVWINGERIEFYARTGTTLQYIRRGTSGTSSGVPCVYDSDGNLIADVNTGNDLVYPVGTTVIDGSNKQIVPGGYQWQANAFGLQYSNSPFAKFLLDKPGSY